ncbi:MAG TPA: hypothetical protein VKZ75_00925 [Cyclobacteriaceae bacterium]|nr:hypothetical protein [Cyclobacteriaceae bacterium]
MLFDIIGWVGVVTYVIAYALLSMGWMKADKVNYHALNAIAGICLVVFSFVVEDVPNLFVNLIWIVIAALSIARILWLKRRKPHND